MHPYTKKLLVKVNSKLKQKPLIYFSRDVERGLGLEKYLENFYLACIEDSYIVDQLNKKRPAVFCLNKEGFKLKMDSTQELLNNKETQKWIKKIGKNNGFYSQLFQFNQSAILNLEKLGGIVLNNPANLNRKFEDKLSQYEILTREGVQIPNAEIRILKNETLSSFLNSTTLKINHSPNSPLFIIQLNRAHTGSGTFFIKDTEDWQKLIKEQAGNEVKVSEFISGESYTINGCVTKNGVFVAGLQYQITGISELTKGEGSTVGNDFSYANKLKSNIKKEIYHITKNIGLRMQTEGYRGLFGLDLVIRKNNVYVIEINARQTANIPFQTKLELVQDKIPLALINLAEWLGIDIDINPVEIQALEGSQVFLRSKEDNLKISESIKSGIYRLQSGNAVKLSSDEDVILLDEDGDKPLIWQNEGYSIDQIDEGGFVLLIQKKGNIRDKFDEISRMQFKNQIMIINQGKLILSPWVIEAMKVLEERVK